MSYESRIQSEVIKVSERAVQRQVNCRIIFDPRAQTWRVQGDSVEDDRKIDKIASNLRKGKEL